MTINYHIKPDDKNQLGNYDYEYDISDSAYGHMDTTQKERLQERMALLAPCVSAFYRWQKEQCRDKTLHPFKFPFDACIAEDDVLFSTAVKSTFDSVYQYHLQNNKSKMGLTPSTQAASATSVATSIAAAPSQIITQAHIEELCALNQLVFEGLYEGENGLASPISLAAAIELYVAGDKTNPLQIKQLTETLHKPSSGMTFISKACGSFPKDQVSYFEKNGIKRVATVNVAEINQEISEATRGKIKDFMPPGSYQSLCYNVLYFKRSWLPEVFIELNRHEDTSFTSLSGTTRNVKKIQTYKVQEMYCAEAHLEDNLKLTFVAIPCASVDARSGTPEMLAILAIPNVRMTLETLPKYRKGLFSSYPKLSWKRRNVSIIMPEISLTKTSDGLTSLLASNHPDQRVRDNFAKSNPMVITKVCLDCDVHGMEGSAASAIVTKGASYVPEDLLRIDVKEPYFVIVGAKVGNGPFVPVMSAQILESEGSLKAL